MQLRALWQTTKIPHYSRENTQNAHQTSMKLLMVLLGSPSEFPYGSQGPRVVTLLPCSLQGRHTGMYERHIAPDWSSSGRGSVRTRRANHRLISGKTLFLFQHLRPADRPRQQSKMEELQNKTLFGFIYLFLRSFFCVALYKADKSHNRCLWDYNGNVAEGGADEASAQRGALRQRGFRSPLSKSFTVYFY